MAFEVIQPVHIPTNSCMKGFILSFFLKYTEDFNSQVTDIANKLPLLSRRKGFILIKMNAKNISTLIVSVTKNNFLICERDTV